VSRDGGWRSTFDCDGVLLILGVGGTTPPVGLGALGVGDNAGAPDGGAEGAAGAGGAAVCAGASPTPKPIINKLMKQMRTGRLLAVWTAHRTTSPRNSGSTRASDLLFTSSSVMRLRPATTFPRTASARLIDQGDWNHGDYSNLDMEIAAWRQEPRPGRAQASCLSDSGQQNRPKEEARVYSHKKPHAQRQRLHLPAPVIRTDNACITEMFQEKSRKPRKMSSSVNKVSPEAYARSRRVSPARCWLLRA
jgi:hypothetical protein